MLKKGQKAPDFELPDQDSKKRKLSDYKGKWIVLYFYPKNNTPGCTMEAIQFTRLEKDFKKKNAVVLGVSKDSCGSHKRFSGRHDLTVTLLSDEKEVVQKKYGVWKPKKFIWMEFLGTVRSTFLIDPKGKIAKIWPKVNPIGHAEEVLESLE